MALVLLVAAKGWDGFSVPVGKLPLFWLLILFGERRRGREGEREREGGREEGRESGIEREGERKGGREIRGKYRERDERGRPYICDCVEY